MRLLVSFGATCECILDERMRNLTCKRFEVDEIWAYAGKKQRHVQLNDNPQEVGDFYTFVAIDAETKLVPSFLVGKRDGETANAFIYDLASRLDNRVQLSNDGLRAYIEAVEAGFGGDVDYGQVVKAYEAEPMGASRYSPPKVISTEKIGVVGNPNWDLISTAYVESQNLTMRMQMRRFTRLTNAFSKKVENLEAAVAVHFFHYNFVRKHSTIKTTPAIAAGVVDRQWSVYELLAAGAN